ncbi:MAG: DUF4126 domain-containing protein [Bryobacteraceae bacterium]
MEPLQSLALALGGGIAAGLRLYATVLGLGIAIRLGWLHLPPSLQGLEILAHPAVLTAAAIAYLAEFISDKIPWFDSLWDAVHTFIRPIGAAMLGAAAFATHDPAARASLALLSGGAALSAHASKAAVRFAVNHSPEPFSNWLLSLAGDFAVPALLWLTFTHPLVTLSAALIFLMVFAWLAVRILRLLRRAFRALRERWFGAPAPS